MKETQVSVARLVEDMDIYPRTQVDDYHVSQIAEAMRAGRQVPALKVGKIAGTNSRTFLIVDGVHRSRAYRKVFGDNVNVPVITQTYKNKDEMILEAAESNSHHGRSLTMQDKTKCIVMLEKARYPVSEISRVLGLTAEKVQTLKAERMATRSGETVPLKRTTSHLAGTKLTKEQMKYQDTAGGLPQSFYVNQVVSMLEADAVDWENGNLVKLLRQLSNLLAQETRI